MLLRVILYSIIGYIVYSVFRRVIRMFAPQQPRPGGREQKYSPKDGAVDADYEELD